MFPIKQPMGAEVRVMFRVNVYLMVPQEDKSNTNLRFPLSATVRDCSNMRALIALR